MTQQFRLTCTHRTTGEVDYQGEYESRHHLVNDISRVSRNYRYEVEYKDSAGNWLPASLS